MLFTNGDTVPLLITRGIPHMHRYIIVVEISQLLLVQKCQGPEFHSVITLLTPYLESQGGGLFVQEDN